MMFSYIWQMEWFSNGNVKNNPIRETKIIGQIKQRSNEFSLDGRKITFFN